MPSDRAEAFKAALLAHPGSVAAALAAFVEDPGHAPIAAHRADIDRLLAGDGVEAILANLAVEPGEWAAANQPVVALIPDDRVKVRFFAPQRDLARYPVGQRITFTCDGCARRLSATIDYVSPRPEFTPPIIYSRESRDRMVFLIEARPDTPRTLSPGQPVDVTPLGGGK